MPVAAVKVLTRLPRHQLETTLSSAIDKVQPRVAQDFHHRRHASTTMDSPDPRETIIMTAWILVSDASRANLYSAELREDEWSLVKAFEHLEGREMSREIEATSPPGRGQQGRAQGGRRTALEPRTWPKEAEAQRFAQHLSAYLEEAVASRSFDYLVLVAPPHFLGMLKGSLGRQAAKHLRATIDKDLSTLDATDLRRRLVDTVFPLKPASH
jgi:protein required for attachment to host cells